MEPEPSGDTKDSLPLPVVPVDAYDERYYRGACGGHEEWAASEGEAISGLYRGSLELAGLRPGEVLVDVGTGRGELLAAALERGAARAIGIEQSPAAVRLARRTLAAQGTDDRAEVVEADARRLPLESGVADLVTLLDVVEHLAPPELDAVLAEARRITRPGGRVFVHTLPNRLVYDVTYRLQRSLRRSRRRDWPTEPRGPLELAMHVNEQTLGSLKRTLRRVGFVDVRVWLGRWILTRHLPEPGAGRLYRRLARVPVVRRFGAADIWAQARVPGA